MASPRGDANRAYPTSTCRSFAAVDSRSWSRSGARPAACRGASPGGGWPRTVRDARAPSQPVASRRRAPVPLKHPAGRQPRTTELSVDPLFDLGGESIPRYRLGPHEVPASVAYETIHDELMLDGNARMNLATFVTTWMEPEAVRLLTESLDKNMIDKDEYPQTAEIEMRCVNILADLWHAPDQVAATGCSTTGSSEAAMLGGLALKRRWQHRRRAEGKPTDRPNLVMGVNVQVCWEKFANYWDVEMRLVPMEGDRLHLGAAEAVALCDENTIGVVAILGPDLVWDFRLPRVASINVSGHKYGLVYPGVGWVVWRDASLLPDDLIFWVNYLGDSMPTFALNFSRPGAQVIGQYYTFLRLGFEGFRKVQQYARDVATRLADTIAGLGPFELLTRGDELPVFAFVLKPEIANFNVFDVSAALRERGWLLPAYTFPKNRDDIAALRVVVKRGFSHDMADLLVADIARQLPRLQAQGSPARVGEAHSSFHH